MAAPGVPVDMDSEETAVLGTDSSNGSCLLLASEERTKTNLNWREVLPNRKRPNEENEKSNINNNVNTVNKRILRDPRLINNNVSFNSPNPFSVLSDNNSNSNTDSHETAKNIRPPPIYLKSEVEYLKFKEYVQNLVGPESFKCTSTTNGITISPATPTAYRILVKTFRENNAEFHTFQLPEDKSFRVVLRGLHHSIGEENIAQELSAMGFEVRSVTNVQSREKVKLPLFFVDLSPNKKNDDIFKITTLFMSQIKVEQPRQKRQIAQCTRCQRYGHTKGYCTLQPRCVKCAGSHESKTCLKTKATAATCALCNGSHPANYRGCLVHKELQQRRSSTSPQSPTFSPKPTEFTTDNYPELPSQTAVSSQRRPSQPTLQLYNSHRQPSITYSQITAATPDTHQPTVNMSSHLTSFLTEMKSLLTPMINLMTQLIQALLSHGK